MMTGELPVVTGYTRTWTYRRKRRSIETLISITVSLSRTLLPLTSYSTTVK